MPNTYTVIVRATDTGGLTTDQTITVNVTDAVVGPITGTLAVTEAGQDQFAGSGAGIINGSMAATETGTDIFTATGTVARPVISLGTYYGDPSDYRTYHAMRGRNPIDGNNEIIAALLVASEWLDGSFAWPGYKIAPRDMQVRDWPRSEIYDRDGWPVDYLTVPTEIKNASYEVAYRWLEDAAVLSPDHTPEKYSEVSIEGALRVKSRGLNAMTAQKQFPILSIILATLMGGSNASSLSSSMHRA